MPEEFIAGYAITFDEHLQGSHDQKTHGNKFGTNDKGEKVLTYKGGTGGWKKSGKTANTAPKVDAQREFSGDALAGMTDKQRQDFLMANGGDAWIKSLSPAQNDAIYDYTGSAYSEVNSALRNGTPLSSENAALVANANAGLLKSSAPADMIVNRGVTADFLATLTSNVGGVFVDPGFSSTTIADKIPSTFQSNSQIHIKVFKGAPGAFVDPTDSHYSSPKFSGEKEWLPPSGSHFNIVQTYTTGSVNHVVMEYRGQPHIGTTTIASAHIATITEATPKPTPASRSNKFIWQEGDVQWLTTPKKGNS